LSALITGWSKLWWTSFFPLSSPDSFLAQRC
jgi:hypothetical protein